MRYVDIRISNGVLRIEPVAAHTFRIRLSADGSFAEPALIRYRVLRNEWPEIEFRTRGAEDSIAVYTDEASVRVSKYDGRITLADRDGRVLLKESAAPTSGPGFAAEFELTEGERLYGLGTRPATWCRSAVTAR